MKNFMTDYINTTLFLTLICSLILILLLKIATNLIKLKSDHINITDDEYFIINNSYNPEKIFYFITYKLYRNGILNLKTSEGKFYYVNNNSHLLNHLESEISSLYIDGLSPKNFNIEMIDENLFREYYNSIYKNLISKKIIKSKKKIFFDRLIFITCIFIITAPEIFLLFYLNQLFFFKIIVNLLISIFIYILLFKETIYTKLTFKGIKANKNFIQKNNYHSSNLTNNNYYNDMDKFLLQNIYMYYFDSDMDDFDDNDDFDD